MGSLNKYKSFSKRILDIIPSKILSFKRAKWLRSKKLAKRFSIFRKRKKIKYRFRNKFISKFKKKLKKRKKVRKVRCNYGVFVSRRKHIRVKRYFSYCLENNRILRQFFGLRKRLPRVVLRNKNFEFVYKKKFVKIFFKIEVLLWKLHFFKSTQEAVQNILHGKVLVNGLKVKPNYFLKKGDIVSFNTVFKSESFSNRRVLKSKFFIRKSLYPFIEVDFFTKTVILLKDETELSNKDMLLLIPFCFNVQKLLDS